MRLSVRANRPCQLRGTCETREIKPAQIGYLHQQRAQWHSRSVCGSLPTGLTARDRCENFAAASIDAWGSTGAKSIRTVKVALLLLAYASALHAPSIIRHRCAALRTSPRELVDAFVRDAPPSGAAATAVFCPRDTWAEDVTLRSACGVSVKGADALARAADNCSLAAADELPDFQAAASAAASVAAREVIVKYNASWTPPSAT